MFQRLPERSSTVDACADVLRRAIVRGELPPGSRLPPERALAQTLGVNRTTLRAALHEIARDGLLAVRQGSGYAVLDFRAAGGADLVPPLVDLAREAGMLRATCAELLRTRRWLAGALLERLAEVRPSPAALEAVGRAIDALEQAADAPLAGVVAADIGVVQAWIRAADSDVLAVVLGPIGRLLGDLPELASAMFAAPRDNVAAWRLMLAGVHAGPLPVEALLAALRARDEATLDRMEAR